MEVNAARKFSPKSEETQTLYSKLRTMEPSEKMAAASERQGNLYMKNVFVLSCWIAIKALKAFHLDIYFKKTSQLVHQKPVY